MTSTTTSDARGGKDGTRGTDATRPASQTGLAGLRDRVRPLVALLYGADADRVTDELDALARRCVDERGVVHSAIPDAGTSVLITYADTLRRAGEAPLVTLRSTLDEVVGPFPSHVHLLPVHPSTSDDGFAPTDYGALDPSLGTWDDVRDLAGRRHLMLDLVVNHVSASSPWFEAWLAGSPEVDGLFIEEDPAFDTSATVRPRTSPLFHAFTRPDGSEVRVWTTFSADQVDLDLSSPSTLLRLTQVLLDFVGHGAQMIRLDAIGFLWKSSGTTSMSLPQTHAVVRLWRALLDVVAPGTQIVTETNVPTHENLSYLGSGDDEAHLVYQFPLPPLVLHAFVAGDTTVLSGWARGVAPPGPRATFLNFLASHDGIGLRGSEGLLSDAQRDLVVQHVLGNGGLASMRTLPDGSEAVYELNTTYLDALATREEAGDGVVVAAKGLAAHSVLLALSGVPAVYVHSLLGSANDPDAAAQSGVNRRISRATLDVETLVAELDHDVRRRAMLRGLQTMLSVRAEHLAFDPFTAHEVLDLGPRVFTVVRRAPGAGEEILCVTNVTPQTVEVAAPGRDLLTGQSSDVLRLGPYGYAWVLR